MPPPTAPIATPQDAAYPKSGEPTQEAPNWDGEPEGEHSRHHTQHAANRSSCDETRSSAGDPYNCRSACSKHHSSSHIRDLCSVHSSCFLQGRP
eukprot:CAMPEP_0115093674 /NCGR_PEP_ID=MMETSP0227-20121206/27755_1 /TAXON_ID=89957 /ORGANISM="Polarella glacialis, Strain CCMP 1383" /LENGTH=93 /DNA_ID=CAMNT_0002486235 /DNA_START=140 /DNA_END=420 /DNA_ORIENTATION=-